MIKSLRLFANFMLLYYQMNDILLEILKEILGKKNILQHETIIIEIEWD